MSSRKNYYAFNFVLVAPNRTFKTVFGAVELFQCWGYFVHTVNTFSPLSGHAIHELLLRELALRGCPELPGDEQDADARWVQRQVVTELLDPVDTDLVDIMRI